VSVLVVGSGWRVQGPITSIQHAHRRPAVERTDVDAGNIGSAGQVEVEEVLAVWKELGIAMDICGGRRRGLGRDGFGCASLLGDPKDS